MKCLATNSQIKKIKSEIEKEYKQREDIFRKQAIEFYATVFANVLTDKYGIGKQIAERGKLNAIWNTL